MKLTTLLLYVALAVVGFWIVGLLLDIARAVLQIALIVGLVLIVLWLIGKYIESKKKP